VHAQRHTDRRKPLAHLTASASDSSCCENRWIDL
jgi:hypothetical protein